MRDITLKRKKKHFLNNRAQKEKTKKVPQVWRRGMKNRAQWTVSDK